MASSYYQSPAGVARQATATRPLASAKPSRRSQRVTLRMPLLAIGERSQGHGAEFKEATYAVRVSAHGGQMELEQGLQRGETFLLRHTTRQEQIECRVVSISKSQAGKRLVGFEFTDGLVDFWRMSFPPPGARPIIERHK